MIIEELNEQFVTVGGVSLRYIVRGTGAPVLLVHGLGEFLEAWVFNVGALSESFRVYAMDLPGHGLSEEPAESYIREFGNRFILDFMEAVGIERASLVGHSIGGIACLSAAIDFPDRVDKLVLVDSGGLNKGIPLIYRLAALPVLGEVMIKPTIKAGIRAGMKRRFHNPEIVTEEWVDISYKYLKMPKMKDTMLKIVRGTIGVDSLYSEATVTDQLRLVSVPTLIIHGKQDNIVPIEHARLAYKTIPRARLEIFDECGHNPHIEKASEFNEAVIAFLKPGQKDGGMTLSSNSGG